MDDTTAVAINFVELLRIFPVPGSRVHISLRERRQRGIPIHPAPDDSLAGDVVTLGIWTRASRGFRGVFLGTRVWWRLWNNLLACVQVRLTFWPYYISHRLRIYPNFLAPCQNPRGNATRILICFHVDPTWLHGGVR